jgi:hypothetical protein
MSLQLCFCCFRCVYCCTTAAKRNVSAVKRYDVSSVEIPALLSNVTPAHCTNGLLQHLHYVSTVNVSSTKIPALLSNAILSALPS